MHYTVKNQWHLLNITLKFNCRHFQIKITIIDKKLDFKLHQKDMFHE